MVVPQHRAQRITSAIALTFKKYLSALTNTAAPSVYLLVNYGLDLELINNRAKLRQEASFASENMKLSEFDWL